MSDRVTGSSEIVVVSNATVCHQYSRGRSIALALSFDVVNVMIMTIHSWIMIFLQDQVVQGGNQKKFRTLVCMEIVRPNVIHVC